MSGNPINVATGNKFQAEMDFTGPGLLEFARYYNSSSTAPTHLLGSHWTNTYSRAVSFTPAANGNPDMAAVLRPDGKGLTFLLIAGVWTPDADVVAKLQKLVDGAGALTGWSYAEQDGREVETFDAQGRVTGITRANGESVALVYDSLLLTSVTGQDGRALTLAYDTSGRLMTLTDPAGAQTTYSYDTLNRLTGVTYPGALSKTYLYNEAAYTASADLPTALTGIVDEKGNRYAIFRYQADGRAISTEHAGGVDKHAMTYNADGTTSIALPSGAVQKRTFATLNGMPKATAISTTGAGVTRITALSYDGAGNPNIATDASGTSSDSDVDARGLLIQFTESANNATTLRKTQTDWHASFSVPLERRIYSAAAVLEAKTTWTYNARGQILTQTQVNLSNSALSRVTTLAYCEQADVTASICPRIGLLKSVDGPRTDKTDVDSYAYYAADSCAGNVCSHRKGDLWTLTNGKGQVTEMLGYDNAGRLLSMEDANGVITDLEYSPRGWLLASKVRGAVDTTEADDAITQIAYDLTGQVSQVTQPDGAVTTLTYDAAHRLTQVADALGNTLSYTLNNAGERIQEDSKDSGAVLRHQLSRVYDSLGQLQTLADAYATPTDFTFDANGRVDTTTDPLGRVSDANVDALGRVIQQIANTAGTGANKATTQFQYDSRDNLTKVIDPKGLNTTYTYDSLGNLTQLVSPDTGTATYGYDLAGNRTSQVDGRGKSMTLAYDALNRLTERRTATSTQSDYFSYDTVPTECQPTETFGLGRLGKIYNGRNTTSFCFDRFGGLARVVQTITAGPTLTIAPTHNSAGQLVAMTYPSGAIVSYLRNSNGQITNVAAKPTATAAQVTLVSSATYAPFGPLTSLTFGNGRVLSKTVDLNFAPDRVADSASSGLDEDFTVNAVGNITGLVERTAAATTATRSFEYDGQDRMSALKNGATTVQAFAYDATGNRLSKTDAGTTTNYTYPASSHRLTQVGTVARTYDGNGNPATQGAANTISFNYNEQNRLTAYFKPPLSFIAARNYEYNPIGQRLAKTDPSTSSNNRYYAYDEAGHVLGEYMANGTRVQEYVWLQDTLVAVLSGATSGNYQLVETNHLGTPRAVVDPSLNTIIWRWNLSDTAFGEHAPQNDPDGNAVTYTLNFRYPGQWYDTESGLSYNYFRDYDPATGRYIESDPVGLAAGPSTYGYVDANPAMSIDPFGLEGSGPWRFMPGSPERINYDRLTGPPSEKEICKKAAVLESISNVTPFLGTSKATVEALGGDASVFQWASSTGSTVGATVEIATAGQDAEMQKRLAELRRRGGNRVEQQKIARRLEANAGTRGLFKIFGRATFILGLGMEAANLKDNYCSCEK